MEKVTKNSDLQIIGKNIKRIRLLRGFSQENVASDLDKSVNFISLLENGKTGPAIQTLIDICRVLKVDANAIFEGIIAPTENPTPEDTIVSSLNLFEEKDIKIVTDLIAYIVNSKN